MGELELVHEVRLETVFPKSVEKAVINAMIKAIHMKKSLTISILSNRLPPKKGSAVSEPLKMR